MISEHTCLLDRFAPFEVISPIVPMPTHLSQIQSTWILAVGEILGLLETTFLRICNELPCKEGVSNFYLGQGCKQPTTCGLHCIMCGGIQAWLVLIHIFIKWPCGCQPWEEFVPLPQLHHLNFGP